jgi:Na+/melibiose symporter-like transporter
MPPILKRWSEMPPSVRNAIAALITGWGLHYVFYFGFIAEDQPERVTLLNLGVGIAICYFVATIRKWARRLSLFFNFIMVVMYSLFTLAFVQGGKVNLMILTAATAAAFGFSFYFLIKKEAYSFFSPPEESQRSGADEPPSVLLKK